MGAPALQDLHKALKLLADQSRTIAQLNVDSDEIVGKLTERSDDVVRFIREAGDTAVASAAAPRRPLDRLRPARRRAARARPDDGRAARTWRSRPRRSWPTFAPRAPGLNTLATNLPPFARATERSLRTLGARRVPGIKALRRGRDEIQALADCGGAGEAGRQAGPPVPRRHRGSAPGGAVGPPRRRRHRPYATTSPASATPMGYTGMEGLLNFFYILSLATNQYDVAGHTTHISLRSVEGPCGMFNAGEDWPLDPRFTYDAGIDGPTADRTIDPERAHPCVGLLGPNQPGITPGFDEAWDGGNLPFGRYPSSVCPTTSTDHAVCDPGNPNPQFPDTLLGARAGPAAAASDGGDAGSAAADPGGAPGLPVDPKEVQDDLEDILDLPGNALDDLGLGGKGGKNGGGKGGKSGGSKTLDDLNKGTGQATEDLLDFLFGP